MDKVYELKLIGKIFDVVEAFTMETPEYTLTELQKKLSMNKATLYRILLNLEDRGYIQKNMSSGKFRLGTAFATLANVSLKTLDIREVARACIRKLAEQTGETVIINILENYSGICIERINSELPVKITADIGRRVPLLRGSSGKILAAFCSSDYLQKVYEMEKKDLRKSFGEIQVELNEIKAKGYAVSVNEQDRDTYGVSFPVYNVQGEVIAGLSLIGPEYRFTKENLPDLLRFAKMAAAEISAGMCYSSPK